jgi:hypothetical protein
MSSNLAKFRDFMALPATKPAPPVKAAVYWLPGPNSRVVFLFHLLSALDQLNRFIFLDPI